MNDAGVVYGTPPLLSAEARKYEHAIFCFMPTLLALMLPKSAALFNVLKTV
jgi:hypothetical protein